MTGTLPPGPSSFTSWLLRPFVDLTSVGHGPLLNRGPLLSYQLLRDGQDGLGVQRALSGSFRANLAQQCGPGEVAVDDPRELPGDRRTPEWGELCELVDDFARMDDQVRVRVVRVLIDLAFHALVVRLVPEFDVPTVEGDPTKARLLGLRGFARYMLMQGEWQRYEPSEFVSLLSARSIPHPVRFAAANILLIYHARVTRNIGMVRSCREQMEQSLHHLSSPHSFAADMYTSRFYRAASYLPFLAGHRAQVTFEMQKAEDLARDLLGRATSGAERIVAEENIHPVLESRAREAQWLGDRDLAYTRIKELRDVIDPWDAKVRLEHAELLAAHGEWQAAAKEFVAAAELGPPGTAIAWTMAGECYMRLGFTSEATCAYLAALRLDPEGLTPAEGLHRALRERGGGPLVRWVEDRTRAFADLPYEATAVGATT